MSKNYAHTVEANVLNAKINGYADRVARITKQGNPAEFEAIVSGSANDLELFGHRIESLLPDYRRDLELITEGFDHTLKSVDPSINAGMEELQGFRREARKLTETAAEDSRQSLANYKIPRRIEFSETELPKSGSGKILKKVLRQLFWKQQERAVG